MSLKHELRRVANIVGHRALLRTDRFGAFGTASAIEFPCKLAGREHIFVGDGVYIAAGAKIGAHEDVAGATGAPRVTIGSGTFIGNGLVISCSGEVTIGERVLVSDRVFIGDAFHDYRDPSRAVIDQPFSEPDPVRIGDGAFLGVNVVVLQGVTIGDRGYVAAGAVVTADVPALTVVAGNPARVIRRWDGAQWVRGEG